MPSSQSSQPSNQPGTAGTAPGLSPPSAGGSSQQQQQFHTPANGSQNTPKSSTTTSPSSKMSDLERIGSRHRDNSHHFAAESEALDQIAKDAEARLAARRQARYEARNIRLKELERKQKEEEENAANSNHVYPGLKPAPKMAHTQGKPVESSSSSSSWVGDLGRSLFGFLIGGGGSGNSGAEPADPAQGTTASGMTATRQRPASHAAQSLQHTPVLVRRRQSKQQPTMPVASSNNTSDKDNNHSDKKKKQQQPVPGTPSLQKNSQANNNDKGKKKAKSTQQKATITKPPKAKPPPKPPVAQKSATKPLNNDSKPATKSNNNSNTTAGSKTRFQNRVGLVRSKSTLSEASLPEKQRLARAAEEAPTTTTRTTPPTKPPRLIRSKSTLTESSLLGTSSQVLETPKAFFHGVIAARQQKQEQQANRTADGAKNDQPEETCAALRKSKQDVQAESKHFLRNKDGKCHKQQGMEDRDRYSTDVLEVLENIPRDNLHNMLAQATDDDDDDKKEIGGDKPVVLLAATAAALAEEWIDTPPTCKKDSVADPKDARETWIDTPSSVASSTKDLLLTDHQSSQLEASESVNTAAASDTKVKVVDADVDSDLHDKEQLQEASSVDAEVSQAPDELVKSLQVPGEEDSSRSASSQTLLEEDRANSANLDSSPADLGQNTTDAEVPAPPVPILDDTNRDCDIIAANEHDITADEVKEADTGLDIAVIEEASSTISETEEGIASEDKAEEGSSTGESKSALIDEDRDVLAEECELFAQDDLSAANSPLSATTCSAAADSDYEHLEEEEDATSGSEMGKSKKHKKKEQPVTAAAAVSNIPPPPPLPPIKDLIAGSSSTDHKLASGSHSKTDSITADLGDFMMGHHHKKHHHKEKKQPEEAEKEVKPQSRTPPDASPSPPPPPRSATPAAAPPLPPRKSASPKPPVPAQQSQLHSDASLSKSDSGYSEASQNNMPDAEVQKQKSLSVTEAFERFDKRYGHSVAPKRTDTPTKEEEEEEEEEATQKNEDEDGVRIRDERRREATKSLSSRRSSTDSSEDGFNLNVRDLKNELRDVEEKFRKAMVANAGLDNDKAQLTYQVELLKDTLEEQEESAALVSKELREKSRDYELLKRSYAEAQRAVQLLQAQLDEQARLLSERGMVLVGNEDDESDAKQSFEPRTVEDDEQERRTRAIVSTETASILSQCGNGPLDVRIKRLAEERDDLQDSLRRLKMDLDEEKSRNQRLERSPFTEEEADWETKKILDDYKFKLQKSEQDINTLQTNVARLESQVVRYKTAAETAERSEAELKTERRKLQRELREATSRVDELETSNKHLETRLGKLKTAKSNLLKDL